MDTTIDTQTTDSELLTAVRLDREEKAFRVLYRRHTPRLFLFVLRIIGGAATSGAEPEAEDIVQETWILVCERLEQFRGEAAFATWLHGIGLNVARNHLRRQRRDRSIGVEELPEVPAAPSGQPLAKIGGMPEGAPPFSPTTSAAAVLAAHDDRIDLERAIALLPDRYRMVLILHDLEGLKHREIAETLSIAEGTCKSQLFAARRWIRSFLNPARKVSHE